MTETLKDMKRSKVALISGHTDLSEDEFKAHYVKQIDNALDAGHHFVIGDAAGVDAFALAYLTSPTILSRYPGLKSRLRIYPSRRYQVEILREQGLEVVPPDDQSLSVIRTVVVVPKTGRDARRYHHIQRDANMTAATDYDILYVRSDEESKALYGENFRPRVSATEMNQMRRAELARLEKDARC